MGLSTTMNESALETVARFAGGSRVIEAFNLTFAEVLDSESRNFGGERPSLPYCGDDPEAKVLVRGLIEDCGYEPIDAGGSAVARSLESLATIWVQTAVVSKLFPGVALRLIRRNQETKV